MSSNVVRKSPFDRIELQHGGLDLSIHRGCEKFSLFIRQIDSKAFGVRYADDSEKPERVEIGHVRAWLFLGELAEWIGEDIIEVADAEDQQSYEAAEYLFGEASDLLAGAGCRNAIYLHHIFLDQACRGMGLAREMLANTLMFHDPTRLAGVILCVNSQFQLANADPFKGIGKKTGDAKLVAYYERLGFRRVPQNRKYMYADMDTLAEQLGLTEIIHRSER